MRPALFALILAAASGSAAAFESGWWWNPSQSGRGFSIEAQGGDLFFAGYLYADDGRATWYVSSGPLGTASSYSGPLLAFEGGQTLTGAYRVPTSTEPSVGNLMLTFGDDSHGTLTWPGGSLPIERFRFAPADATLTPETVWWWNPDEGGRGFAIEVQGGTLVMAGYMYDAGGAPTWYLSSGPMASPTSYQGQWSAFRNGQTLTGPYRAPDPPTSAGTVRLQFNDFATAQMTLPDGRTLPLTRFRFGHDRTLPPSSDLAKLCVAPRPADARDPGGQLYQDRQGTLANEEAWIRSYVNETYLWYDEVPAIDPTRYVVGATAPYVGPSSRRATSIVLDTAATADEAYFNSQRTPAITASGRSKDEFHFIYDTSVYNALFTSGDGAGFGFEVALLAQTPPRKILIAYTEPGTPAVQSGLSRGAEFLTIDDVDVHSGADVATLNEALFTPVAGKSYRFVVLDADMSAPRTVVMTATTITRTPVLDVRTLPTPNQRIGYLLFNDHIATAEDELIRGINQLKAANQGTGIDDLVLDLRYNGGGYIDIASELAYMIAGASRTAGRTFELLSFNQKNPLHLTDAQATTPFHSRSLGFSGTAGRALPQLGLSRVFVIAGSGTCSASEAIINGLRGVDVSVIQIGGLTCGKPYGFFPADNCGTTYFTIQFKGVNAHGFGDYADGFAPDGSSSGVLLPGCRVADDFSTPLGDPREARLAAALRYRGDGTCPAPGMAKAQHDVELVRSPLRENRIVRDPRRAP